MKYRIAVIDYQMGNLLSVKRKLDKIGVDAQIVSHASELDGFDKIILPGVGHFKKAIELLKSNGMWEALNHAVLVEKKPILGICLGLQLMCKNSEEGDEQGFNWFDADVVRFQVKDTLRYKIPHTGWNQIHIVKDNPLMNGIPTKTEFYFVHAYHLVSQEKTSVLNTSNYEDDFIVAMQKDNIYGVQYHPEKSQDQGEQLLRNFATL